MPINFPNSPQLNQVYTEGNRTWTWNGTYWRAVSTTVGYTGSQGIPGEFAGIGYTGSQGTSGTSVKIIGSVATANDLSSDGTSDGSTLLVAGDGFIVQSTGELYIWDGNQWINVGRIVGYTGSQGLRGFTGSAGTGNGGGGSGLDPWIKVTANYTAVSGNRIIADTTAGSFTITLPANPTLGSSVTLTDGADWGTNQLIISGNGNDVEGVSTDIGIDVPGVTVEFIYDGDQWQITATLGTGGIGVPPGGTTGQVLAKISDVDYETGWVNAGVGAITRYLNLSLIGDIAPPSTGNARFYPPENITITRVYANVSLAPAGGNFTFVIKKNGLSLSPTFTVNSGQFTMTPVTVNISVTTADYLTVDTTGAGTSNLNIKMEYTT